MRYTKSSTKKKRRFVLPILIILFLVAMIFSRKIQKLNLNLSFEFPKKQEMVNPLPPLDEKTMVENLLQERGLPVKGLRFQDKNIEASLSGNLTAFLSTEKDLTLQVVSLQFIISRAKIENRLPKVIDLRFSRPVVSY